MAWAASCRLEVEVLAWRSLFRDWIAMFEMLDGGVFSSKQQRRQVVVVPPQVVVEVLQVASGRRMGVKVVQQLEVVVSIRFVRKALDPSRMLQS